MDRVFISNPQETAVRGEAAPVRGGWALNFTSIAQD
jgi:hypothetical protein